MADAPASADCLTPVRAPILPPTSPTRPSGVTDNGRRPSQQLQGPQDAQGRQPGATPISASRRSRRRSATSRACRSRCASCWRTCCATRTARTVKKADIAAFADWLKNGGKSTKEINFRPARVLMQDFTGVPAVVDLAAMRDAMEQAGRRRQEDQSAGPGRPRHRPFGDRRQFRQRQRLRAPTSSSSTSATSSATSSCAGARWRSTISASCRRAPASATRSTSSTWRRSSGPAEGRQGDGRLSRHAGRHRQPHHHGQRPGRAGLGRRRHRGRGRHARPAACRW